MVLTGVNIPVGFVWVYVKNPHERQFKLKIPQKAGKAGAHPVSLTGLAIAMPASVRA